MKTVTIDTCVWVKLIDLKYNAEIKDFLDYCLENSIGIHISSRVVSYDTCKMNSEQQEKLMQLLKSYSVIVDKASFRFSSQGEQYGTLLSDDKDEYDMFSEPLSSSILTDKEILFEEVFGQDPFELHQSQTGKKFSNWVGDYDSLKHHYLNGRTMYVTYDTKIYMKPGKREFASSKLGLQIVDPSTALQLLSGEIA